MINDKRFHTNLPVLATLMESSLKGYIQKNSETSLISTITDLIPFYGTSNAERSRECNRARNLLGILRILKRGLRIDEKEPVTEADKNLLRLTYTLTRSKETKIMDFVLPYIITIENKDGKINPSFGNKAFKDPKGFMRLHAKLHIARNPSKVMNLTVQAATSHDMGPAKAGQFNDEINEVAIDVLLNTPWPKTAITLACIWTLHKNSMYGIPRDVLKIIINQINRNYINDLFEKVKQELEKPQVRRAALFGKDIN